MSFRVVLDACVLLPYQLCDLFLRLAESDMYEPLWSDDILNEVERNLVAKFAKTPAQASRRVGQMRENFPVSAVDGYRDLIPTMTNHPKDRHVLAAAVRGGAALIVTANLTDFRPDALRRYDIEAIHPDDFLQDQLDLDPARTLRCLVEQRDAYTRPTFSVNEFYSSLAKTVPMFAAEAARAEAAHIDPDAPLPLEIVSGEDAMLAFFPDGNPTPATPLGAAFLWWQALLNIDDYMAVLESLSSNPQDWGDYRAIADTLQGWSIMQYVETCTDAPDSIAYIKFMPDSGHPMRAFGAVPLTRVQVLTVEKCPDGYWRVWGLSENYFPSAARVLYGTEE
ncbi:PIN domain-containing protein [Rhodococcus sp. NPDC006774]|jgi:predicted nucleic acid-binding protein|uniref:PIN domain-containing protein n=1 Tax=Rhodococcus sp. NPDC006774 TaxID=3157186 RepID=UPI00340AD5CE